MRSHNLCLQEPTAATATHLSDVKSNADSGLTFNTLMDRAKAAPADAHTYMDSGEVRSGCCPLVSSCCTTCPTLHLLR